jgi:hypothetical protein
VRQGPLRTVGHYCAPLALTGRPGGTSALPRWFPPHGRRLPCNDNGQSPPSSLTPHAVVCALLDTVGELVFRVKKLFSEAPLNPSADEPATTTQHACSATHTPSSASSFSARQSICTTARYPRHPVGRCPLCRPVSLTGASSPGALAVSGGDTAAIC